MKPKHSYNPVYKVNYYFCIGWQDEAFTKYMVKWHQCDPKISQSDGKTIFITCDQGALIYLWTRHKSDYPILSHEVTHAANYTFDYVGHKLSTINDEPQAYLVEYLMREALK